MIVHPSTNNFTKISCEWLFTEEKILYSSNFCDNSEQIMDWRQEICSFCSLFPNIYNAEYATHIVFCVPKPLVRVVGGRERWQGIVPYWKHIFSIYPNKTMDKLLYVWRRTFNSTHWSLILVFDTSVDDDLTNLFGKMRVEWVLLAKMIDSNAAIFLLYHVPSINQQINVGEISQRLFQVTSYCD